MQLNSINQNEIKLNDISHRKIDVVELQVEGHFDFAFFKDQ